MLLELSDEHFKTAIIKLLQQDLPSHLKQMEKKSYQKTTKKRKTENQKEISELKNIITKVRTSADGLNRR